MAYGYYIDGSGNYFEGEKLDPTWTNVTIRESDLQDWGGASWSYNLTRTRAFAKTAFVAAMEADLAGAMSESSIGLVDMTAMSLGVYEVTRIADDPAATDAEVPLLAGYALESGLSKAASATAIGGDVQLIASIVGVLYAYKITTFAAIDASSDAAAILAMTYVRP